MEGADDVGLDEVFRAVDRSIDVAFGGEIDHGADATLFEQLQHEFVVADVAMYEVVTV